MTSNTISFNNFKAFGEKMQTFSKKPITLIYGPNSVGKSSLLHSQLYFEYLKNRGVNGLDLQKTNFAGDILDLDGFENFIHKHETDRTLKYTLTITDEKDIAKLLSQEYLEIKAFKDAGIFDMDKESIKEKLEYTEADEFLAMKDKLGYIRREKNPNFINDSEFNDLNKEADDMTITTKWIVYCHENNIDIKNLSPDDSVVQEFKKNYYKSIEKLKNSTNIIDQALLFTGKSNLDDILYTFEYYNYISSISTIKFELNIKVKNFKLEPELKYYINNELLFEMAELSTVNWRHNLLKQLEIKIEKYNERIANISSEVYLEKLQNDKKELPSHRKIFFPSTLLKSLFSMQKSLNIFNQNNANVIINDIQTSALVYLNNFDKERINQYFGPLRFYPQRWELWKKHEELKSQKNGLDTNSDNQTDSIKKIKQLETPLYRYFYISKLLYKTFFKSDLLYDLLNKFLPENRKLTSYGSSTSQKMWANLIDSKELQDKLNNWFTNDSKLNTQYSVEVRQSKVNYFILNRWFRKAFALQQELEDELIFIDKNTNTEVTPRDMGLGISQVMPIILSSLDSKNTNLFLEQPELHLHPKIQMELADEFIRNYKENGNEFMIEDRKSVV